MEGIVIKLVVEERGMLVEVSKLNSFGYIHVENTKACDWK